MNRRLRLLLGFARKFPGRVVFSIVLGFTSALFNGVNTTLLVPILLQLLGQEIRFGKLPPVLQQILDPFEALPEQQRLWILLGAAIATIVLKNITAYVNTLVNVSLRRSLLIWMRELSFDLLFTVDIDFYNQHQVGALSHQINSEFTRTVSAFTNLVRMVNLVLNISVFTIIVLSISWRLTLVSLGLSGLAMLVNQIFIRRAKILGKALTQQMKEFSAQLLEVLNGIRLIRAVATEDREQARLVQLMHAHEQIELQTQMNSAAIGPLNEVSSITVLIAIVLVGRVLFQDELADFSSLLLIYLVALFRLLPFLGQLNQTRNMLASTSASVEITDYFLQRDDKPFMPQGTLKFEGLSRGITFENIGFHYPNQSTPVIHNITLDLPKGKTLALVGSSGSGKSTLINLLARFYDPTQGRVLLDDRDLKEFDLKAFRRRVGLVSQDTFLFNDSVRYNLAYARPDASDADIEDAARRANALSFIQELPQGWDTEIGDRGVMLSGGQRQRLAIARALLQDPEILLLDEATSALDTVSERLVQQALEELSRDRTVLVVAHRLSTVRNADQIAVMDQGRVVEVGTHGQLLQRQGKYAELWHMQFGNLDKSNPQAPQVLATPALPTRAYLDQMMSILGLLEEQGFAQPKPESEPRPAMDTSIDLWIQDAYDAARNLLQDLQRSEQRIAEFSQLSYQARNYLSAMIGSLQLILEGMADEEQEKQELIQEAHQAGTELMDLLYFRAGQEQTGAVEEF